MNGSALYAGAVIHQRFAPRRHRLRYRLFQLLIDLGDLEALRRLRWLGIDAPGLFSFRRTDHGDGGGDLTGWVGETLAQAGVDLGARPRVQVLCMPRVLGFVFNPLSVFYARRADGSLAGVIFEVNNTFGQRHAYAMAASGGDQIRLTCAKTFHVSPFMGMDMSYAFRLSEPGARITTAIQGLGPDGRALLSAVFAAERQRLTDAALLRAFFAWPLLTLKVVAAIHWEALKLLAKGLRLLPRPADPPGSVTVGRESGRAPADHSGHRSWVEPLRFSRRTARSTTSSRLRVRASRS